MKHPKRITALMVFLFFSGAIHTALATPFTIHVTKTDITCYNANDGSAAVDQIIGGTPPFTFQWRTAGFIPIPGETDSIITGLGPGNYWSVVYDFDGHSAFQGFSIVEPFDIQIFSVTRTNIQCNGGSTGSIEIQAGGGTAPMQFSINDGATYQASLLFSDLPAGDYLVRLLDANGCEEIYAGNPVTLTEPVLMSITGESSTPISCYGTDDGTITVTASGGTGTLTYTLNPGALSNTTGVFTNLGPASYTVTVTDENACTVVSSVFNMTYPPQLQIDAEAFTPISCNGVDDGTITVTASGGTGTLTYTLNPGAVSNTTGTFTGIAPGSYTVEVDDENGCGPVSTAPFDFAYPPALAIDSESSTPLTCAGIDDASISVLASGGTGTLTYTLNPGAISNTSGTFTGIGPGTYTVDVDDQNGCGPVTSSPFTFSYPSAIVIDSESSVPLACFGIDDGSVSVSASGGTGTLTYTLNPGAISNATGDFANLGPASYTVTVSDENGCFVVSSNFNLVYPPAIVIVDESSMPLSCNGVDDAEISVSASGGTGTLTYTLDPGAVSNTTGTFTALGPGDYTVTVSDDNGCSVPGSLFSFSYPPAIAIDSEASTDITCPAADDASITISASGGTGTLTYTLNPGAIESNTTGIFTSLPPGTWSVAVSDLNGCGPVNSSDFIFTEPDAIDVTVEPTSIKKVRCYGDNNGSLNISVSGGTPPYEYSWTGPDGFTATSQNIGGLAAGLYHLMVTDANACVAVFAPLDSVVSPPEIVISLTATNITCFGGSDGTITASVSGGVLPFEYSRNGITWQSSNVFTGLSPALYTIYVRDASVPVPCIRTETITVSQPARVRIISEMADNTLQQCHGDSNGVITIEATGGTGNLWYSVDSAKTFQAGNVFTDLPGGLYYTFVRDDNGCTDQGGAQVIDEPLPLYITNYGQVDIVTCFDAPEGQVLIEASGGATPLSYIMDASDTNQTGIFTGLMQGDHGIRILDGNGCRKDTAVFISSPPQIIFAPPDVTPVTTCWGDSTGAFTLHVSGGTGAKEFSLGGGPFQTDSSFSNLPGGDYHVTARDALGCLAPATVNIASPGLIGADSVLVIPVSCQGDTNGSIRIAGSGGTPPYLYTLNPGAVSNATGVFNDLSPGTYTVTIEDAQACPSYTTPPLEVTGPPALLVDSVIRTDITCAGSGDGMLEFFVSGGIPPYEYSADDGASWDSLSVIAGLAPGSYITLVRSFGGCLARGDTITLLDPPVISVDTYTAGDVATCAGDSSGTISVSASGGTGVLEYSLDSLTWQPGGDFVNLPAGDYTVLVRDSKGCTASSPPLTIDEPPPIVALITTQAPWVGQTGTITISAWGGTGTLEYSIDGPGGPFVTDTLFNVLPGFYDVVVRDQNGCTYQETVEVAGNAPLEVDLTFTYIQCHDDNDATIVLNALNGTGTVLYSIDDGASFRETGVFDSLPGATYLILVKDEDLRIFRDAVEITNPEAIDVTATIRPATCSQYSYDGAIDLAVAGGMPPYTYLWSNDSTSKGLSGLEEGDYSVTITDNRSCQYTDTYTVTAYTYLVAGAGNDTTVCRGSQVILNGSGGTIFYWWPEDGLSNPAIPNPVATVTDSVSYVLTTAEPGGCVSKDTITLTVYPDLGIDAGGDTTLAEGQSLTLHASGGAFASYQWLPQTGLDNPISQSPSLVVSQDITYIVTGTTIEGCQESDTVSISVAGGLVIYSGFTPNGDGINDFWDIDYAEYFPNMVVMVYDRWGRQVFHSQGYSSDKRWDGRFNGEDLPTGTYYYVVDLKDGSKAYKGPVTIVR